MRAEFELELARAHRLLGHLDLASEAATSAREMYGVRRDRLGGQAMLVGLLIDLDRQRRPRRERSGTIADATGGARRRGHG